MTERSGRVVRAALACAAVVLAVEPATAQDVEVGRPLPPRQPGTLDIHQISTGRGNAALVILPDGTTLLVDAGGVGDGIPETDPHPDATRTPGAWIARYVRRHLPPGAEGLDFALVTHFHVDHMGGLADVAAALPIGTIVDRGWPDYAYPRPLGGPLMEAYRTLVNARGTGAGVEAFRPGVVGQIRQLHAPEEHPGVEIRNVVGNGVAWTGTESGTRALFPPLGDLTDADLPTENMCSLGIRLTYGAFRWFTGGDLPGTAEPGYPAWHALEPAIADVVGPVDVHVVGQHGSMGQESEPFLRALDSEVHVIPGWAPSHPAPDVLKRIMNSRLRPEHHVFVTDMRPATRIVIGQRAERIAAPPGHVVVRVEAGGARYRVIATTSDDESDTVLAVAGPFEARGGR